MHRTPMETEWPGQGQLPRILNSLRDVQASYLAEPVDLYLGANGPGLKGIGERFESGREAFGATGKLRVDSRR